MKMTNHKTISFTSFICARDSSGFPFDLQHESKSGRLTKIFFLINGNIFNKEKYIFLFENSLSCGILKVLHIGKYSFLKHNIKK